MSPRRKRTPKAAEAEAQPVSRAADPESTTFQPLEVADARELSDKERAERTQFKPVQTKKDGK